MGVWGSVTAGPQQPMRMEPGPPRGPARGPGPSPAHLGAERDDAGQQADQDVGVHAALVGLVQDQHRVPAQQEVLGAGAGRRQAAEPRPPAPPPPLWGPEERPTFWISLSSTPSVMNLILVSSVTFPS